MNLASTLSLLRLLIVARLTSAGRRIVVIARAEPFWVCSIGAGLVWGCLHLVRLQPPRAVGLPIVAVALTQLLSLGRNDARLLRILGVAPWSMRLSEALLWTAPLLVVITATSPRNGLLSSMAVALIAVVAVGTPRVTPMRSVPRTFQWIPLAVPEWKTGLRRAVVPLGAFVGLGIVGSGAAGLVVIASIAMTFVTCGFFWTPSEGWLLLHARGQSAPRLLVQKMTASVCLLLALIGPTLLLAAIRQPELLLVYSLVLALCVHAQVAAVAVKYAGYAEGRPLHAVGSLAWFVTTVAILLPPVGVLLLLWLYRRAVARIAPFCVEHDHGR